MAKKLFLLAGILLLISTVAAFAGGGGEKPAAATKWTKTLKLDVMGFSQTKFAIEDKVTPYFRQQTGVEVTVRSYPDIPDPTAMAQTLVAANDVPDAFAAHMIPPNEDALKVLVDKNLLWEFSEQNIRQYMPRFTARMEKFGDLKIWLAQEKRYGGKNWAMSNSMTISAFSKISNFFKPDDPWIVDVGGQGYGFGIVNGVGLRDDILKKIFPSARSYKEQVDLYVKNNGKVDPKIAYSDIPITTLDDLLSYLRKAKAIIDKENLMAGAEKMIPGLPWSAINPTGDTMGWSCSSLAGYPWLEPPFYVADPEPRVYYYYSMPAFKDWLKWANGAFNEGLIDPEVFVQTMDQGLAKVTTGRYAVLGSWHVDVANVAAEKAGAPYRYRMLPMLPTGTLKNPYQDLTNQPASYHTHHGLLLTKKIKQEDLAQAFNWADYQMSEDADILRAWGPPDFYTGTGKERRFKPEYKDMENHKVYGITGGKDGYYYGAPYGKEDVDGAYRSYETSAVGFFGPSDYNAPQYVYPRKASPTDPVELSIKAQWLASIRPRVNYYPMLGWSEQLDIIAIPSFAKVRYALFGGSAPKIANMVRGKPEDFEAQWTAMRKFQDEEGLQVALDEVSAKWKEIYNKYVKQYWDHNRK